MAYSSSRVSRIGYVVFLLFLCLSLVVVGADRRASDNAFSPFPRTRYDVFVSFSGQDTRRGFLSQLVKGFRRKKIHTFVDYKLQRGEEISTELFGAIERSSISLVIFSEKYASSYWCLEELVKILECKQKHGQIVIPVFYHVAPSDVRHQRGSYGNALARLEKKYGLFRMQIFRSALEKAANLSGFDSSEFRNEDELLDVIIKFILTKLNCMHQVNSKGLIVIDKPIAEVISLLHQESEEVRVIGIWGMGGIGKTTIAEEVFYRLCSEYEGCSFLANVREEIERHGIISLKNKLLSALLQEDLKIDTEYRLPASVSTRLSCMRVLIVLDDVNDINQLEILVGAFDWFGSGSRIIVATRDKQVLVANGVNDIYQVGLLSSSEALELFSLRAFKQRHPEMEYCELTKRVVNC